MRQQEIESLSQRFAFVVAQEMKRQLSTANQKALGLEPPQMELALTYQDGQELKSVELAIGNKVDGKNEYYLRSSNSMFLMTWASHYVQAFEKDPKDWFDPKALAPNGAGSTPVDGPAKQTPTTPDKKAEPQKAAPTAPQPVPGQQGGGDTQKPAAPPAKPEPAPPQPAKPQPVKPEGGKADPAPSNPAPKPAPKAGGGQRP